MAATKRRASSSISPNLPELLKGRSTRRLGHPYKWVRFGSASYAEAGRFTRAGLPGYLRQSVTLIRESGEAETLVEFEGDKREAIALPIEKVRELIGQAMSSMATTRARR